MKNTFNVISPIDNSVYLERKFASSKKIEKVLASAKKAQKKWRQMSIAKRAKICRKAVQYFLKNANEIGTELTWQMGRPIRYTPGEITGGFAERAKYMIDIAAQTLADVPLEQKAGFQRFIRREPLGTVFVLAPWNYPYLTSVNAIIPALMSGNTVILKHAQQTPLCAERYAEAFKFAGAPAGVFQYLHITHTQVAKIINDSRIDYVAFTGSVAGGKAVQRAASKRFIATGLELGGKDPAYVRRDADVKNAVENLVDGAFFNSGQSCCGVERIYVHQKIFKDFVDGFVDLTKQYILGDPLKMETTLGPMVKTSAAKFAQRQIKKAIKQGAENLIDPKYFPAHRRNTPYMAPQVLIHVNHKMDLMMEESFAPVVGIMAVKNDKEAIRLMNDSPYGLTASIWTTDLKKSIQLGDQIETGTCFMNRCDYLDPELAWTGVKNSGRGCTLSSFGYDGF
ncbi:MAG TPA: aldehyde dehydrogenase family protein, partial [Saprospiraceae bacterium]|nr:aldehyde dehydrogenase family protein [Saprospiraceae bacterium]